MAYLPLSFKLILMRCLVCRVHVCVCSGQVSTHYSSILARPLITPYCPPGIDSGVALKHNSLSKPVCVPRLVLIVSPPAHCAHPDPRTNHRPPRHSARRPTNQSPSRRHGKLRRSLSQPGGVMVDPALMMNDCYGNLIAEYLILYTINCQ